MPFACIKRRQVPLRPPIVLRTVTATHAFSSVTEEELSFVARDSLEIIEYKPDDGWWKATLGGKTENIFVH